MSERTWLNIVIIIISSLILAFMLLGRLMNPEIGDTKQNNTLEFSKASSTFVQSPALTRIDFGSQQVIIGSENNKLPNWRLEPPSELSIEEIKSIVLNWQKLLNQEPEEKISKNISQQQMGNTVLLYFSGSQQPVVVKVGLVELHINQENNKENQKTNILVTFISTQRHIMISDLSIDQLIPRKGR